MDYKNKKYVFIGNRFYVYKKMVKLGLNIVKIFAMKDSFLAKYLDKIEVNYNVIEDKSFLIDALLELDYDVLVSNGCGYILPITKFKDCLEKKNIRPQFINVHTSLLPDCKGRHPVNAAILFDRHHGVTCHYMDDGIDTGEVIEQIEIPITDDVSLDMLYKLSFMAEGDVFERAYNNGFEVKKPMHLNQNPIYYTRSEKDLYIRCTDNYEMMCRRIRAFSANGMYAKIIIKNIEVSVNACKKIENEYIKCRYKDYENYAICLTYSNCILFKLENEIIEYMVVNWDKSLNDFDTLVGEKIMFANNDNIVTTIQKEEYSEQIFGGGVQSNFFYYLLSPGELYAA